MHPSTTCSSTVPLDTNVESPKENIKPWNVEHSSLTHKLDVVFESLGGVLTKEGGEMRNDSY